MSIYKDDPNNLFKGGPSFYRTWAKHLKLKQPAQDIRL